MPKKRSQNKKFNNPSTEGKRLIDSYNLHNFPDCPPDSPSFVYTRVLSGGLSAGPPSVGPVRRTVPSCKGHISLHSKFLCGKLNTSSWHNKSTNKARVLLFQPTTIFSLQNFPYKMGADLCNSLSTIVYFIYLLLKTSWERCAI
jgi:hypothetical protein